MSNQEWAVVTGASGGLGKGFAERLARDGLNVVLASRGTAVMEATAAELRAGYGVAVDVVGCDLSTVEGRDTLVAATAERQVGVLINNAGFGTVGPFVDADPARIAEEISLNCAAVALLARAYAPAMVSRGRGAIVNVASTAAFQPLPSMAVYAATKAFVLSLSQALWDELRPAGVSVLGLCPGATDTAFFSAAGDDAILTRRRTIEQVIDTCFDALKKGKPYVIDGALNAAMAITAKVSPVRVAIPVSKRVLHT
ncbi:MAG TPA: SDR family oxidoreductase [Propionibacteriaceae bacterium]|nr:SDR family oxidoreductase [Propionibacteriaceae bacterium]